MSHFDSSVFFKSAQQAADFLKSQWGQAPKVAVILGSGLAPFVETLSNKREIRFSEIPGGQSSSVVGHSGKLILGNSQGKSVVVMNGRIHGYEGHHPHEVVHLPRALKLWGVENFIITNATGSTSLTFKPGSLVLIKDQINLTAQTPLLGKELFGGDRFPDMSDVFDRELRRRIKGWAKELKVKIIEGVYMGLLGPAYETPSEIKMFRKLGGDIVGMSTVWETIALRQMGARLVGISCVTNFGTGVSKKVLSHDEVLDVAKKASASFNKLVTRIIQDL